MQRSPPTPLPLYKGSFSTQINEGFLFPREKWQPVDDGPNLAPLLFWDYRLLSMASPDHGKTYRDHARGQESARQARAPARGKPFKALIWYDDFDEAYY